MNNSKDLVLKGSCDGCGSTSDLYGSNCKHTTLCLSCGKSMAKNRSRCRLCGSFITNLIREYNVRASANPDKSFSIGRFATGLPPFSKKKNAENRWVLQKEGLQGRQITDALRDKYKNKPWILEDETGQYQYQGQLEGSHSTTATYYLLMMHGKEFLAFPAGSWYNFNKIAQYKQLTLEEAEEKMSKRRNNATGYERWMMKAATNGAAAFGESNNIDEASTGGGRPRKVKTEDDKDNNSDKGEEDEEDEKERKNRLGLNKSGVDDDDDNAKGGDFDLDDDDIEKGDDWEHEEIFTDDDEAVGNNPEEREDLAPEIPAPPEIKQDEEDEDEETEGGLSKSGKELKKLLGKAAGLDESDGDEDDDDEDDDDAGMSPVLAPKQKDASKDESAQNTTSKGASASGSTRSTPATSKSSTPATSKSSKTKRKPGNDDAKTPNGPPAKKVKSENSNIKEEVPSSSKPSVLPKPSALASAKTGSTSAAPVTEDEIRAVLLSAAPLTTQDLVAKFKARLKTKEDKAAFAEILKGISKIQKNNGHNYIVLREK